jgi:hypothetical protein
MFRNVWTFQYSCVLFVNAVPLHLVTDLQIMKYFKNYKFLTFKIVELCMSLYRKDIEFLFTGSFKIIV